MKLTAVIMAGGRGERFWPRSRTAKPKQFLSLTADKETMLQKTVNRLKPLLEMEAIYVVFFHFFTGFFFLYVLYSCPCIYAIGFSRLFAGVRTGS